MDVRKNFRRGVVAIAIVAVLLITAFSFPLGSNSPPASGNGHFQPFTGPSATTALYNIYCTNGAASSCAPLYPPAALVKPVSFWDPVDQQVVYFSGGTGGGAPTNATWAFNGSGTGQGWTQFSLSGKNSAPPTRINGSGAWDVNATNCGVTLGVGSGCGVVFGGYTTNAGGTFRNDTWIFEDWANISTGASGVWTKTNPNNLAPSQRAGAAMVYVPVVSGKGGYDLLFGGNNGSKFFSGTWMFNNGVWTNITSFVGTPPAARSEAGIAWDDVDHYAVMFGGLTGAGLVNDTWKFDPTAGSHGTWTQLFASGGTAAHQGPKAAMAVQMANDTNDGVVWLTGGATGNYATGNSEVSITWRQTYSFVGGQWSNQSSAILLRDNGAGTTTPLAGFGAGFVYAPTLKYIVYQGGRFQTVGVQNTTTQLGTLLGVTLTANFGEIVKSTPIEFYANVTFSTSFTSYVWTVPAGCSTANTSTLACTSATTGFVTVSVAVSDGAGSSSSASLTYWVDSAASAAVTLTVSAAHPVTPPLSFWAMDYRCAPENNATCIAFIRGTPVHTFRVAGSMEGYDAFNNTEWSRFGGAGAINWNWTDIDKFCAAVIQPCNLVTTIPTAINNTGLAVQAVKYTQANDAGNPNVYFGLGNEPEGWINFNPANHYFATTPIPTPYTTPKNSQGGIVGYVVDRIAQAVVTYYPNVHLAVIQSPTCASNPIMDAIVNDTYSLGMQPVLACHSYPGHAGPSYAPAANVANLLQPAYVTRTTSTAVATQTALHASGNLPVWIQELSPALQGGSYAKYTNQWPEVSWFGAQLSQFWQANFSMFEPFYFGCGPATNFALLSASCVPTPAAGIYNYIGENMRQSTVSNVTYTGSVGNLYASFGKNASGDSLLISNVNTSVTAVVTVPTIVGEAGATLITGNATTGWTTHHYAAGSVPATLTVGPMTIVLLNANLTTNSASWSVSPSPVLVNQSAQFRDTSTGGCGPYTYSWHFGDNTTATTENPAHTYTKVGSYRVNFTRTDCDSVVSYSNATVAVLSFNPGGALLTGVGLAGILLVTGVLILGGGGGYFIAARAQPSRPSGRSRFGRRSRSNGMRTPAG